MQTERAHGHMWLSQCGTIPPNLRAQTQSFWVHIALYMSEAGLDLLTHQWGVTGPLRGELKLPRTDENCITFKEFLHKTH